MATERFIPAEGAPGVPDARPDLTELRRLAAVVSSTDDAVLTKNPEGIITSWNKGAERLYGYTAEEAIGRPITLVFPPERLGEEQEVLRAVIAGRRIERYETERLRKDGRILCVSLTVSPVRDDTGVIVEASVIARDISAVRRADRQRERLQTVTAALSTATTAAEVVDVVLRDGFEAAEADGAFVVLRIAGTDDLEVLGVRGYTPRVVRAIEELSVEAPLPVGEALRTGEAVWLDGDEVMRRHAGDASRFGLDRSTALVALPLTVRGDVIGALGLRFSAGRPIDESERGLMLALADQCAQALDRARLFEAEQRARRRAEYLARAGAMLGGSLSVEATLEQVARLAVPELADWVMLELLERDGSTRREVLVHSDPDREQWARRLAERHPPRDDSPSRRVMRTGEPELIVDVTDEMLRAAAVDNEHLEVLRNIGFRSVMTVALRARGRVLGVLTLVSAESERRFGADDLAMAQEVADRCALALDNAQLFAERSYIAQTLQEGLLPSGLPDIPRVELTVRYRAASQEADVGGDFYDVFAAGGGWMFVTGDVVGKGAKAAAITGLARHTLRASALYEQSPAQMLRALNRAMLDEFTDEEQFCTVAITHLCGHEVRVVSGGHPLPLVLRADGSVHAAGRPGPLIGVLDDPALHEVKLGLDDGDTVVLYTDGVIEARGRDGRFGSDRLAAVLAMSVALPLAKVIDRVDRTVAAFRSGEPTDDSAIVAYRLCRAARE